MKLDRRSLLAGSAALALASPNAGAQGLSANPITIVVPFTPGTGIDILARAIGERLRVRWNQPVVIDNKPGASGNIGAQAVARLAAANGHTLLMTVNAFVMNPHLYKQVPYDPVAHFAPIIEVATGDLVLVAHPSLNVADTRALVAAVKASDGKVDYASPGVGTPQHLAMELFKQKASVFLNHVPYRGSAGAVQDVVAGHVKVMFMPLHTALPFARNGQVKVLAIGSARRSPQAPDVPTLSEAGFPGVEVDLWYGLLTTAGTAPAIVAKLNAEVNDILREPALVETLRTQGLVAVGGTPQDFAKLIAADFAKWGAVVKAANISAD
jgi:tripartite-type tricarboxylate transporter receptor subunit TctC